MAAIFANIASTANAEICKTWGPMKTIGQMDTSILKEGSGIVVSREFPGRLYHVNDHGHTPAVYVTDYSGKVEQTILTPWLDKKTSDTESMSYGKCGDKSYIFVGDTGDNDSDRSSIRIAWFEEKKTYPPDVAMLGTISLTYPDHPHNTEAMIVHPNGDLILFTKEFTRIRLGHHKHKMTVRNSQVYRLKDLTSKKSGSYKLESLGELQIPALVGGTDPEAQIVTDSAVYDDGRILLLTYGAAIELSWAPGEKLKAAKEMKLGRDYSIVRFHLPHQESIGFLPDGSGFIATSEKKKNRGDGAPIVQIKCAAVSKAKRK
jgi:hypothetical protein